MRRGLVESDDWLCFNAAEDDGLTADTVGRRTHGGVRVLETERRPEMVGSRGGRTLKLESFDEVDGDGRPPQRRRWRRNATASCSLCAIWCKELLADRPRCWMFVIGLDIDHGVWSGKDDGLVWTEGTRLICASFGSTRLIYASFESTRLICAFLGITRLIGVSFGITRLICAFYGTTRLLRRVRVQRGANRREAGRMREGHIDASGFLYASADVFCENIWFCDFELMT
ncbi:hypothetical protein E5676_scaffold1817G00020 [Cucumis melo var. makuwa]|uniref:Uncharacterized protein n=1 Tax=Cucumis melo var. makuwa TaxID=1194695 RepID=A0A5D3DW44_CUCMM|nr:hypothetical protein E5676_scaffold1817G00020 [Cucumis melo var. makuwa]